jgi:3-oxoacyl-[acyl-carrier-protein] synthase I
VAVERFAVTGLGMITSVGPDAVRACAAIRAGMSRPRELPAAPLLVDPASGEEAAILAHPVDGVTNGFVLVGAWMSLALECLDDLVTYAALPAPEDVVFWGRTGLLVVVPSDLLGRFGEGGDDLAALELAYLAPLVAQWKRPLEQTATALVPAGNAGGIAAIERAVALLGQRACERVIVLAADSFVDSLSLDWLAETRRLKGPDNPVGLSPGEAASCILLESLAVAKHRQGRVEAFVEGVALSRQDRTQSNAKGLSAAIRACLAQAQAQDGTPCTGMALVSDIDGQPWRAQELGAVMVDCADLLPGARVSAPATSLGHTGGASALVGACVTVRSFVRGYAHARRALVVASSEAGQVGAVCFSDPSS